MPLDNRLRQSGQLLNVVTANFEVTRWLRENALESVPGTTGEKLAARLAEAKAKAPAAARPAWRTESPRLGQRHRQQRRQNHTAEVLERLEVELPTQHPLAAYERLIEGKPGRSAHELQHEPINSLCERFKLPFATKAAGALVQQAAREDIAYTNVVDALLKEEASYFSVSSASSTSCR